MARLLRHDVQPGAHEHGGDAPRDAAAPLVDGCPKRRSSRRWSTRRTSARRRCRGRPQAPRRAPYVPVDAGARELRARARRLPRLHAVRARHPGGVRRRVRPTPRLCSSASSPGTSEDRAGRPFVGPAGEVFDRALAAAGIDRAARIRHQRGEALLVGSSAGSGGFTRRRAAARSAPAGRGSRRNSNRWPRSCIVCLGATATKVLAGAAGPGDAATRAR